LLQLVAAVKDALGSLWDAHMGILKAREGFWEAHGKPLYAERGLWDTHGGFGTLTGPLGRP